MYCTVHIIRINMLLRHNRNTNLLRYLISYKTQKYKQMTIISWFIVIYIYIYACQVCNNILQISIGVCVRVCACVRVCVRALVRSFGGYLVVFTYCFFLGLSKEECSLRHVNGWLIVFVYRITLRCTSNT